MGKISPEDVDYDDYIGRYMSNESDLLNEGIFIIKPQFLKVIDQPELPIRASKYCGKDKVN